MMDNHYECAWFCLLALAGLAAWCAAVISLIDDCFFDGALRRWVGKRWLRD